MPYSIDISTAEALLGAPVSAIAAARIGGNSRLYRVTSAAGRSFALKVYPERASGSRDRLATEWQALRFLASRGVKQIPRPIATDPDAGLAMFDWIEGSRPKASPRTVSALCAFLAAIQAHRECPEAQDLGPASAHVGSGEDVIRQLIDRRARLMTAAPQLAAWLTTQFDAVAFEAERNARKRHNEAGLSFDASLPRTNRILSPSDFGLHNALESAEGLLHFVDFEYFGWDDPAKAICDMMLHPGSALDKSLKRQLYDTMRNGLVCVDPVLTLRIDSLFPLFGLIWILIILNVFLPNHSAHPDKTPGDHTFERERRLIKAREYLTDIRRHLDGERALY